MHHSPLHIDEQDPMKAAASAKSKSTLPNPTAGAGLQTNLQLSQKPKTSGKSAHAKLRSCRSRLCPKLAVASTAHHKVTLNKYDDMVITSRRTLGPTFKALLCGWNLQGGPAGQSWTAGTNSHDHASFRIYPKCVQ